jgi:AAA domain-containing protein
MNILVIGRRGLGKSTLAEHEAQELNANRIYFDPGNQFHNVAFKTSDLDEFFDRLESWPDDEPFVIAYTPPKGNVEKNWDMFASRLWDYVGTHEGAASFVFIIDESHRLQSAQYINDMLDEFIRRSPRRERGDSNPIDLIQTTHYPQDLNRTSWGESDYIFFFNVFHKRARKAIEEQFGPEVADQVANLKTPKTGGREVLKVESETGTSELLDDDSVWFYNIRQARPPKNDLAPGVGRPTTSTIEERYGRF